MKIISIGTDRKVLDKNSPVYRRVEEYKKMFDSFEVILFSKLSDYFKIFKIGRLISKDTVVTTQDPFETGLFGLLLKLFYGAPLQVQLHTDFRNKYFLLSSPLNFIRFFLGHLIIPFANGVRVVSKRVGESISFLNKNVIIFPIIVEKSTYLQEPKTPKSVLTVCRLEKEKNLETAIKAFKTVSEKFPKAMFTIVGEGSERKALEKLSKNYNLTSRISFVGWQNDLKKYYGESEIYISTSLFEGYGMSVVEAALAGCALVISNTGIAGEIPALVSKQKDVEVFAKNLGKLLENSDFLEKMSEDAKTVAESLVIPKEEYLRRYKTALESISKK